MNTKRNFGIPNEISKSFSFIRMLIVYLVICGVGVCALLTSFDILIRKNNKKLTDDTATKTATERPEAL